MKKIITHIETHQVRITRRAGKKVHAWCAGCAATVRMIRPETFARLAGISVRTVYRQVEAGQLHFLEPGDDQLLLCANSLTQAISTNPSTLASNEAARQLAPAADGADFEERVD